MPTGRLIIPGRGQLTLEEERAEMAQMEAQIRNAEGIIDLYQRLSHFPMDRSLVESGLESALAMKKSLEAFRDKCIANGIGQPDEG